jgi:hypothetical protein
MTGTDMIYSAVISSLHIGTYSFKKGKFLDFTAPTYIDLLNKPPTANETNNANRIGRNKFTFSVVSNIITAREKDSRE